MYRLKDFESRFPPETKGINYQFKRGRSFCEGVTLLAGVKSQDYLFVMADSSAGSTPTKAITRLVTNSLKTGHEAIAAQKESGTSTKRLSSDASGSWSKRSLLLQDAPQKQTSSEQEFMLLTRDTLPWVPEVLFSLTTGHNRDHKLQPETAQEKPLAPRVEIPPYKQIYLIHPMRRVPLKLAY